MKSFCGRDSMKAFVTVYCRKTCNICKGAPTDCKHSSWGEWSKCSKPPYSIAIVLSAIVNTLSVFYDKYFKLSINFFQLPAPQPLQQ